MDEKEKTQKKKRSRGEIVTDSTEAYVTESRDGKALFKINHIGTSNFSDVKVFSSGYERVSAKKKPRETDDFGSYSMHFVLSGGGTIEIDGAAHSVKSNQAFFLFPKTKISYYPDRTHPWRYCWMDFFGAKVIDILRRLGVDKDKPVIDAPPAVGRLLMTNVSECMEHSDCSDLISISKFYAAVAELCKLRPSRGSVEADDPKAIAEKSLRLIDENFSDPSFGLEFLSSSVGLNPAYLSRLIKQRTGVNFSAMLTRKRLTYATHLIDLGVTSVSQIASDCGFSDAYYFSRVFRRTYEMSPRDYIREAASRPSHPDKP